MSTIEKKKQKADTQQEREKKAALAAQLRADRLKAKKEREAQADAEWDRSFANSHDALAKLAAKARKEYREGRTEELDPDNL
jgi:hypothetical protein